MVKPPCSIVFSNNNVEQISEPTRNVFSHCYYFQHLSCRLRSHATIPIFITIQVTMRTFKGIWFFMIDVKKYFFILQFFMFDLGGVWGEFFRSLVVTVMANHKITAIGYRLAQPKSLIPSRGSMTFLEPFAEIETKK